MDRKDLTETFTRLRQRLRSMAVSILRDEENADDALQEAFCRIWTRKDFHKYPTGDGLAFAAVRNICLDYLRRKASGKTSSIEDCDSMEISRIKAHDLDTEIWEESEMEVLTRQLMQKLSDTQHRVFEMVSNGVDYDIVALRLEIPESTVRQHMCRARKIMRDEYRMYLYLFLGIDRKGRMC